MDGVPLMEDLDELAEADKLVRPHLDESDPWPRLEEALAAERQEKPRARRKRPKRRCHRCGMEAEAFERVCGACGWDLG